MSTPPFFPFFKRRSDVEAAKRREALMEALEARNEVRELSPEPVPFVLIESAIDIAKLALSYANRRRWRFVVVANPGMKHLIREAAEVEDRALHRQRVPDERGKLATLSTYWHKPFFEIAPYLIVVFRVDDGLAKNEPDVEEKLKKYFGIEWLGTACAILLAALHLEGLATLTHTPRSMGFLGQILNRPKNEKPHLLISAGYPVEREKVADIKKSLEERMQELDELLALKSALGI